MRMMLRCLVKVSMAILQMGGFVSVVIAASSYNDNFITKDTISNLTSEEKIEEANRRYNIAVIPCTAYIGLLIVVGIMGNSLVFYVFGFRLKRNPQNCFIWILAVLDLLSCTLGLSAEIIDLQLHFKFPSSTLCKAMRFVNYMTTMSSICTLLVIAIDRYRKIRKPLKPQMTLHQARLSVIPIMIATLIFSSPAVYVYGIGTIETGIPGVPAPVCTISDQAKLTIVPHIYIGVLFISFIILATSLIVMYSLILRSLKEYARFWKLSTRTVPTVMECLSTNETVSTFKESVSSGHLTDCDNPRKQQSISAQSCHEPSDFVREVFSAVDLNGSDKGSNTALCWNAANSSNNPWNQSTLQPKGCDLVESYDSRQKDMDETTQMSSFIVNNSYVTNKDQMKDIETCHPTVPTTESHSREDNNCKDAYDTKDSTIIEDHCSGYEDDASKGPTAAHKLSFDVSCSDATNTDLPNLKTWSRALPTLGSTNKRKLSETSMVLRNLDNQSQKYVNQILKIQKHKEDQSKSNDHSHKDDVPKETKQEAETRKQRNLTRKTTIIAFVVTLVFIISFVPHLCLSVAYVLQQAWLEKLEGALLALYNIFVRSYFINSVANPIIYGLMNDKFRDEVKLLVTWLPCCRRKR